MKNVDSENVLPTLLAHMPKKRKQKPFSDRLREWRDSKGYTQAEAATFLGVNLDTFQNWEGGRNKPRGIGYSAVIEKIS